MEASVRARRLGYRIAYRALAVWWRIARPEVDGVKCLIIDGPRVLMVRHTYGPRQWDLPGGRIGAGEAPVSAAAREMHEELGLEGIDWQPVITLTVAVDGRHDTLHAFTGHASGRPLTVARAELAAVAWFDRDALPTPIARHAAELVARLAPVA